MQAAFPRVFASKRRLCAVALALTVVTVGCGGGMPLLHPAHTLSQGQVSAAMGASGHFLLGDADSAIENTDGTGSGSALGQENGSKTAAGVSASVLGAPGVAPYAALRVGVAERTEAGLAYTGRSARIDARHALEDKNVAGSAGLGLRVLLSHPSSDPNDAGETSGALAGVDTGGLTGFGVDVPVIVGYRSDADVVQVWGGARGGYEQVSGQVLFSEPTAPATDLEARRLSAEGLLGLSVGLSPVWVAAELAVGYVHVDGELSPEGLETRSGQVSGVTVTPAGAIVGRF